MGFFSRAIRSVKKAASDAGQAVNKVTKPLNKIPVVGTPLYLVAKSVTAPAELTAQVMSGANVSRAVVSHLKEQVKHAKEAAPYAQMVVSVVPGVGTGAAAAIAAGAALAEGRPLDQAALAAIEGAVPGGPLAQAAFRVAAAGVAGKPLDEAALQAIPLPPAQRDIIVQAMKATKDIASGKSIDETLLKRGIEALPKEYRGAVQLGLAVGRGKSIQAKQVLAAYKASGLPAVVSPVNLAGADELMQKVSAHGSALVKLGAHEKAMLSSATNQAIKTAAAVATANAKSPYLQAAQKQMAAQMAKLAKDKANPMAQKIVSEYKRQVASGSIRQAVKVNAVVKAYAKKEPAARKAVNALAARAKSGDPAAARQLLKLRKRTAALKVRLTVDRRGIVRAV